jgi:TonB family protein
MRGVSSALSLSVHVAIAAAVVLGTVEARPHSARRPQPIVMPPRPSAEPSSEVEVRTPVIEGRIEVPPIPIPLISTEGMTPAPVSFVMRAADTEAIPVGDGVWMAPLVEELPQILSSPLAVYPELLRQARIQGHVVLEVVVDTTGRVETGSLTVVSATHPGFVAPARRALLATLFRPGRVQGRAVRVLVRVPIDFTLRDGMGPAR